MEEEKEEVDNIRGTRMNLKHQILFTKVIQLQVIKFVVSKLGLI